MQNEYNYTINFEGYKSPYGQSNGMMAMGP